MSEKKQTILRLSQIISSAKTFRITLSLIFFTVLSTLAESLSGYVKDISGNIQPDVIIEIFGIDSISPAYVDTTDSTGMYLLDNFSPQQYQIRLSSGLFQEQWFSSSGNTTFRQGSIYLYATQNLSITKSPFTYPPSSSLVITIVDSSGQPMTDCYATVTLYRLPDKNNIKNVNTVGSNVAFFNELYPATYAVSFYVSTYPMQYFDPMGNTSFINHAFNLNKDDTIKITTQITRHPKEDKYIFGLCQTEDGVSAGSVTLSLYNISDLSTAVNTIPVGIDGKFGFDFIQPGKYYLKASSIGFTDQWFSRHDRSSIFPVDILEISMYDDVIECFVTLTKTPIDNGPSAEISVSLLDRLRNKFMGTASVELITTDLKKATALVFDPAKNIFTANKIPAGKYELLIKAEGYPNQYYSPNVNTESEYYTFDLRDKEIQSIDVILTAKPNDPQSVTYGNLTGSVSGENTGISDFKINVYDGSGAVQNITTDTYGNFSLNLVPSQYFISVENSSYLFENWSVNGTVLNKNARAAFSIYTGQTTTISIDLKKNSEPNVTQFTISGSVQDKTTLKPVGNCRVLLLQNQDINADFNFKNFWSINYAVTDELGSYSFSGISEGEYLIAAESDTNNYVAQFYKDADQPSDAIPLYIQSASVYNGMNFNLRKGAIIKGTIKDNAGFPLGNVSISIHQKNQGGRYYQTSSAADGSFEIRGIPTGIWDLYASAQQYIWLTDSVPEYNISEGNVTNVNALTFEAGGVLSGSFTFSSEDRRVFEKYQKGRLMLFNEFSTDTHNIITPISSTDAFLSLSTTEYTGFIESGACKNGKWRVVFSPEPQSFKFGFSDTAVYISGLGYSVLDNAIEILPLKTVENVPFKLKKGYSVLGKVMYNNVTINGKFNVNAYVKIDDKFVYVSNSYITKTGCFELPGLIQGEKYYLQVWAEGFPSQYWSPSGNSFNPDQPYVFDTTSFVPMTIVLNDNIDREENQSEKIITLWQEKTTDGKYILKWNTNSSSQFDTFSVYTTKQDYSLALLTTINAGTSTTYSFQDNRTLESLTRYVILGKGKNFTARSNILFCYPGSYYSSSTQAWINVCSKRDQIIVDWGSADNIQYSETDSVSLFRRINNGNWSLLERRSSYERQLIDWKWSRRDSGKTFEYKIELKSGSIVSASRSIKIDDKVLSQLSANLIVGTYEKYKTIQQAIDVADDFDNIYVQSGTYAEKLDFKGKVISINGLWEFGKPPVIDASGNIAVTIPFNDKYSGNEFSRIEGFKIQNAKAGIMTASNVDVNNCLFVNVIQAIISQNDSSKLSTALNKDPFFPNGIMVNISQCTFIGKSRGDLVVEIQDLQGTCSDNITTANGVSVIKPLKLCYSEVNISRSIFYQYFSRSLQSNLPVRLSCVSSSIRTMNCNVWETSTQITSPQVFIDNYKGINPDFKDTLNYLLSENSTLRSESIGYGSGSYNDDSNRPSAVKNLQIRILSMNSIGLSWEPSAVNERVAYYKVYRVPGDTSLFYINESMLWDLRISKDSIDKKLPVFITDKTYYVDTSITGGIPYIYAVAAIDSNGKDGKVKLTAPPPITDYMVNIYTSRLKISGQKWYMLSPWGENTIKTSATASVFHWDDKGTGSSLLSQYVQCSQLKPGDGYWVKSSTDTVLEIPSGSLSVLRNNQDSLKCHLVKGVTGWNQIGSPFPFPVYPSWLNNIPVWEWNPDSMGYSRAYSLKPWTAYWAYVEKDTSLLLLNKTWPSVYTNNLAKRSKNICWEINLSLSGKSAWDPENRMGVTYSSLSKTDIFNTPEPPLAFGASQLYFLQSSDLSSNFTEKSNRLSDLYKNGSEKNLEWLVAVTSSGNKSQIEVQGVDKLPEDMYLFWVYGKNIQDLKECNQIAIEPHENAMYGYIIATSDIRKIANYRRNFYLRTPYPNPFRSSTKIEYFIPYQFMENGMKEDANGTRIQLTVYNLIGKKVKTLVNGVSNPGFHCVVWNGTGDNMQSVTAGFYIVRLQSQNFTKTVKLFRMY